MTGIQAWSIVAPLITSHMHYGSTDDFELFDMLDTAYILVYAALNRWDAEHTVANVSPMEAVKAPKMPKGIIDG